MLPVVVAEVSVALAKGNAVSKGDSVDDDTDGMLVAKGCAEETPSVCKVVGTDCAMTLC